MLDCAFLFSALLLQSIDALPTRDPVSDGLIPPKEFVAVLQPSNSNSSSVSNDLNQKYIIKDNLEMHMDIKFKGDAGTSCKVDPIFSGSATNTSGRGCQGLYIFSSFCPKAGAYTFSFSLASTKLLLEFQFYISYIVTCYIVVNH